MTDSSKTNQELLEENAVLKQRIKELEQSEVELRQSQEEMLSLQKLSRDIFLYGNEAIFLSQNGKLIFVNTITPLITGYSIEELITRPFIEFIYPDDREMVIDRHYRRMKGEELPSIYSFRIIHKNSNIMWVELNATLITWKEKPAVLNFLRDITDRKRVEGVLRESELFLKASHRIARLGGWKANPHTDYLEWTEGVYDIIEEPEDFKPCLSEGLKYFLPPYIPIIKKNLADCLITGEPFNMECGVITATGKHLWTEIRAIAPIIQGERSYVIGTFQDITERKRAEDKLRNSEERIRLLLENANEGIFITQDNIVKFPNKKTVETIGYTAEELACIPFTKYVHPEDCDMVFERQMKHLHGESLPPTYTFRAITKLGKELLLEINVARTDWEGRPANINFIRDVTDQLKLEMGWRKAEFIINSAKELMTLVNRNYIYEAVNNAYCNAHAKPREEILGKSIADIWGENKFSRLIKPIIDRSFKGEILTDEDWIDFAHLGSRYFVITYYPYYQANDKVTHVSIISHDITDRIMAENSLRMREKELELHTKELEEANTALRVFFKQQSEEQKITDEKLQFNVNELVLPYVKKLQKQKIDKQSMMYLELLEANLNNIVSPFMRNLSAAYQSLTPQEMQIAEMIRQGKKSKEIATILNLSLATVKTHRNNIRKKAKLRNQGTNLRSYLLSLS